MTRHGPLWGSTEGAASGWVRMTCDCGWKGTVQAGALYAIEEYGDHRQALERERRRLELQTCRDTIDRMDRVHRDQMRVWAEREAGGREKVRSENGTD